MANKKINQLDVRTSPSLTDLLAIADPSSGYAYKITGTSLQSLLDVTNRVPYTGATASVDLGEFGLTAGQLTLDTTPTGTAVVGTTQWNDTIGSSQTLLKGGNVLLKNGVDLVARVVNKVSPATTLTKAAYQAVRVSGAQGQRLAVAYAQANTDNNSADTIGLVCETIAANQEGFIMTVGQLLDVNTTGSLQGETWADGDVLYLSPTTAGALTNVKPNGSTGHIIIIGYVEYAHANNGKIYVKVMNGWELDELHNVYINAPANNEVLTYESSTSLWKNKSIATALGYTPANDSLVMHLAGTETATGVKTFSIGLQTTTGNNFLNSSSGNTYVGYSAVSASPQKLNVLGNANIEFTANRFLYLGVRSGYSDIAEISTTNATYLQIKPSGLLFLFPQDASSTIILGTNLTKQNLTASALYGSSSVAGYGFNGGTNAAQVWKANLDSGGGVIGNFIFHGSDYGAFIHRITTTSAAIHTLKTTGQLQLHNYTSTTSFTGTVAGLLGFDSSGNIITTSASGGGGGISGSGTAGQVTYWSGTSAVTGSGNLFWDNTNGRLGIGTSSPGTTLDVRGIISGTNTSVGNLINLIGLNNAYFKVYTQVSPAGSVVLELSGNPSATSLAGAYMLFTGYNEAWIYVTAKQASSNNKNWRFGNQGGNNYFAIQKLDDTNANIVATPLTIFSTTGNVLLQGTAQSTTDNNYRLDINGTGATAGALRVTGGNVQFGSSTGLNWDNTNSRLGIGTSSPAFDLQIRKASAANGEVGLQARNTTATGEAFFSTSNDVDERMIVEIFGTSWASLSQVRKGTLTSTAQNGMAILIANNSTNANFSIQTTVSLTERFRLFGSTGNVTIQNGGTYTDNGYRLDVQGTFRATGQVRLSGLPTSATGLSTGDLWNNSGVINIV